jgi:hypothetical protein
MKKVSVELGSWIQIVDSSDGSLVTGQLEKYLSDKPFDENNLAFKRKGYHIPIFLDQIVHVFPKIELKENPQDINPSKRESNES